jgi:hypothetical protein
MCKNLLTVNSYVFAETEISSLRQNNSQLKEMRVLRSTQHLVLSSRWTAFKYIQKYELESLFDKCR